MKIMVLSDGDTYSNIEGCKIIDIPEQYTDDHIEEFLDMLNHNDEVPEIGIIGSFDIDGNLIPGDTRKLPDNFEEEPEEPDISCKHQFNDIDGQCVHCGKPVSVLKCE